MPFNQAKRSNISHGRAPTFLLPLLLLFTCVASTSSVTSAADNDRPNVVVVMADDLGYGDIGCYGAKGLETPNIDRMASEGCRFTSGYCSASTCTPTRYSFLTGTYAFRFPNTGIAPPNSPALIPAGTTTTASILQDAGYKTAVIGKWHLGLGEKNEGPDWNGDLKPGPLEIGFDHCILLPTTNDRVPQVYVNDHNVENLDPTDPLWVGNKKPSDDHPTGISHRDTLKMDWSHGHNSTIHNGISRIGFYTGGHAARFRDEDLSDRWVAESKRWIAENKDEPFFLFFASHDLHVPRVVHERFQGSTELGPRGDAIAELDWCVGELMKSLEENGLTEKTMLVFCSDNGPVLDDGYKDDANEKLGDHDPNGPYQGGKYTVYEGGTRTPFITRMPGTIPVGVNDEMVCTIDFAASLAAMVGQELPDDACLDSQNVLGAMMNQSGATGREHLVQQDNGKVGNYGYRVGNWKLVRHDQKKSYNFDLSMTRKPVPRFALYNLESDPAEQNDLSDSEPERAKQMQQELQKLLDAGRSR